MEKEMLALKELSEPPAGKNQTVLQLLDSGENLEETHFDIQIKFKTTEVWKVLILTHILHHKSNTLDIFIYIFTFRGVNPGSRSALTLGVDVFFFLYFGELLGLSYK